MTDVASTSSRDEPAGPGDAASPAMVLPGQLPPLHGEVGVRRFFSIHLMATVFPLTAGVLVFGWRALLATALVLLGAVAGLAVWRRIGMRGGRINVTRALWMSILLAMALPANLASDHYPGGPAGVMVWPILPAAGLALAIVLWLMAGFGSGRLHPVPVVYLMLVILFQALLTPHLVLHRSRIITGDVTDAVLPRLGPGGEAPAARKEAWTSYRDRPAHDALFSEPASKELVDFTAARQTPSRTAMSLEELLRDTMPPLEDLIVAGAPAPLGLGSAIAIIMGGLFLLYRGVLDFRVPLLMCVATAVALLLLPIPVAMTENALHWRVLALHAQVGWPVAITFVSYELMAGPLLFVAFYLASAPGVRPLTRRGRAVYAILIGVGTAALQLYLDVSYGAYLALLIVSLATPLLDRLFVSRPLV